MWASKSFIPEDQSIQRIMAHDILTIAVWNINYKNNVIPQKYRFEESATHCKLHSYRVSAIDRP